MHDKSVCVFCGAREGVRAAYGEAANAMGAGLAAAGWRLVYGAGDVGLMGRTARAAQEAGGATFGVIPEHLVRGEALKTDLTRHVITETMHERKKVMFMNSDAVVVLPGGAGSLDEFFEVLTWRQLRLHTKPIFLVDIHGYWQPLEGLITHAVDEGFADPSLRGFYRLVPDVPTALSALRDALSRRKATKL